MKKLIMKEKVIQYLAVTICWICASIGLFWQVYTVSEMFFTFSTRVDIEMDAPLNLIMPAITICLPLSPNLITLRSLFNIHNLTADQIYDQVTYLPISVLATLETVDVKVFCRTKYPRVIADAPDGQPCDLFGTTLHRLQYNTEKKLIFRCTTYLRQGHSEPPLTVIANEAKDFYALDIYSPRSSFIYVYVHNPSEIFNLPESDFFVIFTNQSNDVVITASRLQINLPKDTFYSSCLDYNDLPFGRMSCIFNCRLRTTQSICGSWSSEVPAPLDVPLSFRNRSRDCPRRKEYNCAGYNICPVQCQTSWYTTSLVWNHMKETPSNLTKFFVRRPYGLQFIYNVTPYMALVEYSCYVASCLGIWFGISFSDTMFKIFETLNNRRKKMESSDKQSTVKVTRRRKFNHPTGHHLNCCVYWPSLSNEMNFRKSFPSNFLSPN